MLPLKYVFPLYTLHYSLIELYNDVCIFFWRDSGLETLWLYRENVDIVCSLVCIRLFQQESSTLSWKASEISHEIFFYNKRLLCYFHTHKKLLRLLMLHILSRFWVFFYGSTNYEKSIHFYCFMVCLRKGLFSFYVRFGWWLVLEF